MLLYAIFPLFYKCFKKTIIRPYIAFLICFMVFVMNASFWYILDSLDIPEVYYNSNFFFYFSFLNQLPSFVSGIYMFSVFKTNNKERKPKAYYCFLFLLFFGLLLFFKYGDYEYGSIYTPYLVGLSFVYLFELTRGLLDKAGARVIIVENVGRRSFGMYLLNTFIAWEVGAVIHIIFVSYNETLVYLIWLPISITILYFLSIYYERIISSFSKLIFK